MSVIKLLRKVLYGSNDKLYVYEQKALKEFYLRLQNNDKNRLLEQLNRIDLIQRYPDGKMILFYDLDDMQNEYWPSDILFDNKDENIIVDKFEINLVKSKLMLKVIVNTQNGVFFGMKFNKGFEELKIYESLCKKVKLSEAIAR